MKNFEEKSGIFRNEVRIEEIEGAGVILVESFPWATTSIGSFMKFIAKLENENIRYIVGTDYKLKCQDVYIYSLLYRI
ncbi:MAG: hypothetical protein Q8N87_00215 [bacterium]|nr:hypothetical protein [bacterium]